MFNMPVSISVHTLICACIVLCTCVKLVGVALLYLVHIDIFMTSSPAPLATEGHARKPKIREKLYFARACTGFESILHTNSR